MDTSKNPAKARGSPNRVCDLVGRRFSRLLVVGHAPKRGKHHASQWACLCDCGKRITVRADNLLNGHTRSCGCLGIKHGFAHRERLYGIWKEMHRRCSNAHYKSWRLYGGKGSGYALNGKSTLRSGHGPWPTATAIHSPLTGLTGTMITGPATAAGQTGRHRQTTQLGITG